MRSALTPTQRHVCHVLDEHMNPDGWCFPSIARLAEETGLADSTVRLTLKQLEAAGWVAREPGAGVGKRRRSTGYQATLPDNEIPPTVGGIPGAAPAITSLSIPPIDLELPPTIGGEASREKPPLTTPPSLEAQTASKDAHPLKGVAVDPEPQEQPLTDGVGVSAVQGREAFADVEAIDTALLGALAELEAGEA